MFNFNDTFENQSSIEDNFVGYAGEAGNVILIIISIIGIIINLIFSVDYSKNIITIKNRNNAGISTVEKILCFIAIIETFISIFWMVNNLKGKSKNDERCKIIAHFEINIFISNKDIYIEYARIISSRQKSLEIYYIMHYNINCKHGIFNSCKNRRFKPNANLLHKY